MELPLTPVEDVPEEELGVEHDRAVDVAIIAEDAETRVRNMYVELDGIADGGELVNTEKVRRAQTAVQPLIEPLKEEAEAWDDRRDAIRDRMQEEGMLDE